MRILVGGFVQETNTFSPVTCDISYFRVYAEGQELLEMFLNSDSEIRGFLECIREHGDEPVPGLMMRAPSNGRVDQAAADHFVEKMCAVYDRETPDAVFLSMHGGMAINHGIDDGTGYIYRKLRQHVGPDLVMTSSHDMHSNITRENVTDMNAIAGFQTYPHIDRTASGYRAAMMGYKLLNREPFHFACVRVPMIVPAEGYTSASGIFKELMNEGHAMVESGTILDFSVFQMQPWLNVESAASAVTVAAEDRETAERCAKELAHRLFDIREQMGISLYSVDEVIDAALENQTDMPVILVDSADSPNAGASADSSAVLERLLARKADLKCAIYMNDAPASDKAFALGVGAEDEFELGGTLDPAFQKAIRVRARVHSLHEGLYYNEGPVMKGVEVNVGPTAVLRIGKIDVVAMRYMTWSYDPQAYRGFGVDPTQYDLVVVKSATQYKAAYSKFSNLFYPTDTPGSATANLVSLPFDRIPRPFYPFDQFDSFDDTPISY